MTSKEPRQTKTPRQRAEEALAVAERKVTKLRGVVDVLEKHLRENKAELREAERLHEYAKAHPSLQSPAPADTEVPSTTTTKEFPA